MIAAALVVAAAIPVVVCTAWNTLGVAAIARVTRPARRPEPARDVPVSVLKPLAGADPDLERNLESFFRQDHAALELVFGVTRPDDPALAVVERLRARFPSVPTRVVVHDGARGTNPKVANLLGIIDQASHDVVLVSDSNVVAPTHYVAEAAGIFVAERASGGAGGNGLVTHLFAGVFENGLGSALESVQLAGFCASGAALPTVLGDALVVGKSMMFSRRTLASLGGLARVADVLAEDWLLGKTFQHAGLPIVLAPTILQNVTRNTTPKAFVDRQLRWAMMRARLRPALQTLELLASPLAMLPLAVLVFGWAWALSWALALLWMRDLGGWLLMRGLHRWWLPALLSPLREIVMLGIWAQAPFRRHVSWRGHRVRLGMGTYAFVTARRRSRAE